MKGALFIPEDPGIRTVRRIRKHFAVVFALNAVRQVIIDDEVRVLIIGLVIIEIELSIGILRRGHPVRPANWPEMLPLFQVRAMPGVVAFFALVGVLLFPLLFEGPALFSIEPHWVLNLLSTSMSRKKVVVARSDRKKHVCISGPRGRDVVNLLPVVPDR